MTYNRTILTDLDSPQYKMRSKTNCSAFNNPGFTIKPVLAMIQKLPSDLNYVLPEAKTLITVEVYPIGLRG